MITDGVRRLGLYTLLLLSFCITLRAADPEIPVIERIGIFEELDAQLPLDINVINSSGEVLPISTYFKDKPVIISFVYYSCPMLCNLISDGLLNLLNSTSVVPGKDVEILSISIDPEDTVASTAAFRDHYHSQLNNSEYSDGWHFLAADDGQAKILAESVGFRYEFDEKSGEFFHAAGIIVFSPSGKVTRYLYGIEYPPFDFKMATLEAAEGRKKSTVERVLLFCYNYDPNSQAYTLVAYNVMRIAGLLTVGIIVLVIVILRRQEKKRLSGRKESDG